MVGCEITLRDLSGIETITGLCFHALVTKQFYTIKRRRGSSLGRAFLVLFFLLVLPLLYLLLPFGPQRAVLLGSDARADEISRSDTIAIVKAGGSLAVPRDTLLEIPGAGKDKVNAAFAIGGPRLTVETLENFTGLSIENYVVLDFGGVEEIVNALGGITIEIEEPIETEQDGEYFFIPAGTQRLTGAQALAYVRYRGGPTADIGRIGRQQRFLAALTREVSSPENLPRLPATARAVWRNIQTNMSPLEAARFATRLMLSGGDTRAEIYPGTPEYINGVSYWVPDTATGERVVAATVG